MLKRIYAGFCAVLIGISFCACGADRVLSSSDDFHHISTDNADHESVPNRMVEFAINDSIMEWLSLDDATIELLDKVYLVSSEAYASLSAHQFVSDVYDAIMAFNTVFNAKFYEKVGALEDSTEEKQQFILEVSNQYTLEVSTVAMMGLECAEGNISEEHAAFEILSAVDTILNYFYKDYVAIYQPRVLDIDSVFAEYEKNELAAESEFKNQLLCVSGTVYEVARDIMDQPYVGLATSEELSYELLRCYVDLIQDDVVSLEKGDSVTCVIQIMGKDAFHINATLWEVLSYDDHGITGNQVDDIRESLRNDFPNDYTGAKNEFQRLYQDEEFLDEYYFTEYECRMIRTFEEDYHVRILRETYKDGWIRVESQTGEVGDDWVYIGEDDF